MAFDQRVHESSFTHKMIQMMYARISIWKIFKIPCTNNEHIRIRIIISMENIMDKMDPLNNMFFFIRLETAPTQFCSNWNQSIGTCVLQLKNRRPEDPKTRKSGKPNYQMKRSKQNATIRKLSFFHIKRTVSVRFI